MFHGTGRPGRIHPAPCPAILIKNSFDSLDRKNIEIGKYRVEMACLFKFYGKMKCV
jgi:hypothetical protein